MNMIVQHEAVASAASPSKAKRRWKQLLVIIGVESVDNSESSLITTLYPAISRALTLNNAHLGTLNALGRIASIPAGPAWVWLGNKIGRKQALVATTVLGGLLGIASAFSASFLQLAILQVLMVMVLAGGAPLAHTIIADLFADNERGRAFSLYFGALFILSSVFGPLIALFSMTENGWRYALATVGALSILAGILVAAYLEEPQIGASDGLEATQARSRRSFAEATAEIACLFSNKSYLLMLLQRLLSGHLVLTVFAIQFLVSERGYSNVVAASVLIPGGVGHLLGTLLSGFVVAWLDKVVPFKGRVAWMQFLQLGFAAAAYIATQYHYDSIWMYCLLWALMGFFQAGNPPVNRPILFSIVSPQVRGYAFAIFSSIVATFAAAAYAYIGGHVAKAFNIQTAFLWILVVAMVVNAICIIPLYFTYQKDVERTQALMSPGKIEE